MSDLSANLALPLLQPSQAQKHVTHNEALQRLDALTQIGVMSATRADPPVAPDEGARWLLPAGCTGAWAGQDGALAAFQSGGWVFHTPRPGWLAWVADSGALLVRDAERWQPAAALPDMLDRLGVGTGADDTNRLSVAAAATLLTHDGAGHQLKLNKASPGDTGSLLFQTGWSGRAEMGLAGSDEFEIKTSADGSTFHTALRVDAATGTPDFPNGATGLAPDDFGPGPLVTRDYVAARGTDLVANGTGLLANGYNYPAAFVVDRTITPNLPASFSFAGHHLSTVFMTENLAVDPNQVYRLSSYLRQEAVAGPWSGATGGGRHLQYMGLLCTDADGLDIQAFHHMRHHHGGVDSRTVLTAPLSPGDTVVQVADASGWAEGTGPSYTRGIILFGYRNSLGYTYRDYSRLVAFDLFAAGAVDKNAHTITLNAPFPANLGNPDDPSGTWPVGTALANSDAGPSYKYAFYSGLLPDEADRWYRTLSHIGGIDRSGTNAERNFPPGTAYARPLWLPNYSNRVGGWSGYPDTGTAQRVWFAGVSVKPEPLAMQQQTPAGSVALKVPVGDFASGAVSLAAPVSQVLPL